MDLKQVWLAFVLLVAVMVVAGWSYATSLRHRGKDQGELWAAHVNRVRRLPRFRFLARRQARWLWVELVFIAVALAGTLLLVARPQSVEADSREMRSRDVMLCLDVSGSMIDADQVVIASYLNLVEQLDGQRIGLVVWDSSAVTAFPLTDDYEFVTDQLQAAAAALAEQGITTDPVANSDGQALLNAARLGTGSSLIGDGLMSCLTRFDQRSVDRPRTVVFATDNELAGAPLFTLAEAGARAVDDDVLVFAISPGTAEGAQKAELRRVAERSGGELLDIVDDPAMEARVVHAVEQRQRQAILDTPRSRSFDQVWPGALLLAAGLAGMLASVAGGRL